MIKQAAFLGPQIWEKKLTMSALEEDGGWDNYSAQARCCYCWSCYCCRCVAFITMFYLKIWPNAWVPKFNPGSTQVSLAGAQILATTTTTTTTTPSSSSRDRQKFHDLYFQTLPIWCGGLNQLPLSVFRPRNATKCTSLLQQTKRNSLMPWLYL